MEFKLVYKIVKNIQDTIYNTGRDVVSAVKPHTFKSKVVNFPKVQKINGIVTVSNQKRVEKELKVNGTTIKTILKSIKAFKFPKEIKINNFPDFPDQIQFPKTFGVNNFPKQKEYPKNIRVTNQPTKEIKALGELLKQVKTAVGSLKLDPTIKVQAPKAEKVIVPPAKVMVTQEKIDLKKLAKLMPEPAKDIDYKKLSEAIAKELAASVVSIGGGGSSGGGKSFMNSDGRPERAYLDSDNRLLVSGASPLDKYKAADIDQDSETVWYYGFTDYDENWYILKEDKTVGAYRYFSGSGSYPAAWTGRAGHSYEYLYAAF